MEGVLGVSKGLSSLEKRIDSAYKKPFIILDSKLGYAQKETFSLNAIVVSSNKPDLVKLYSSSSI